MAALSFLEGKKVGYYVGSFDPFHCGHQKVVETVLEKSLVDYVIIYPVPGGDIYKNRIPVHLRREMVAQTFASNRRVIVPDWTPAELQEKLAPHLPKMEIFGMIGSDVVTETLLNPDDPDSKKKLSIFMRGLPTAPKHTNDTVGALMALKASSFIVNLRDDTDLTHLKGMVEDRPIRAFVRLEPPFCYISSTRLKAALKTGSSIADLAPLAVRSIIDRERLYS